MRSYVDVVDVLIVAALAVLEFCLGVALGVVLAHRYEAANAEAPAAVMEIRAPAYDSCADWGRHGY